MIVFDLCDHTGLSFLIQEHIALPQGNTEILRNDGRNFNLTAPKPNTKCLSQGDLLQVSIVCHGLQSVWLPVLNCLCLNTWSCSGAFHKSCWMCSSFLQPCACVLSFFHTPPIVSVPLSLAPHWARECACVGAVLLILIANKGRLTQSGAHTH